MTTPDADSIGELIEDCAAIPAALRVGPGALPVPRSAASWSVSEACLAQVHDLDEYV